MAHDPMNSASHLTASERGLLSGRTLHRPKTEEQWGFHARPSSASRPSAAPEKKFEAKGHDRQLQEAQHNKSLLKVFTMAGELVQGQLIRRDRYTLTLKVTEPTANASVGDLIMLFKHAIESIAVKAPVVEAAIEAA